MQLVVNLPDELAQRFQASVPQDLRNAFITELLNNAIIQKNDALYQIALDVENDPAIAELQDDWEVTLGDGLETR